jgi:Leucine-rich repeat (LRR) protein
MTNLRNFLSIAMLLCFGFISIVWGRTKSEMSTENQPGTWDLIRKSQMKQPESAEPAKNERVVHFPKDRSLGKLYIQDMVESQRFGYWFHWTREGEEKEYLCEAQGDVRVPSGKRLCLSIHPTALKDLSALSNLKPDDLYNVSFQTTDRYPYATDEVMPFISKLTGLKSLNLKRSNITDEGMKYITNIKSLESLDLPDRATNRSMAYVSQLTSLKRLYFYEGDGRSPVTDSGLRHLAKLTNLEELALSGESMGDAGMVYIKDLPRLEYLFIRGSHFGDNGMVQIKDMKSLKMLTFHEGVGYISDAGLICISDIPNLNVLCLHGMRNITDEGIARLTKMRSLKKLEIGSSQVTDKGLLYLSRIKTLERLDLPQQQKGITDIGVGYLAELPNLKELSINRVHSADLTRNTEYYTDKGLESLAKCKTLEVLGIGSIGITDVGLEHVAKLTNLKRLTLYGCDNVTDKGLAQLAALKSLRDLNIAYGQITLSGINQLNSITSLIHMDISLRRRDVDFRQDGAVLDLSALNFLEKLRINFPANSEKFADEDLKCLAGLKSLKWLNISPYDYTDKGIAYLEGLTNLEILYIGGGLGLTDEGLKYLSNMKKLNLLSIEINNLTDQGLRYLEEFKSLRILDIYSENDFSDAALSRLWNELPNLSLLRINGGILSMVPVSGQ